MKIRVGIEGDRAPVLRTVRELAAPVLVSANSLWRRGHFRVPSNLKGLDVALDSGGFVAMKRYGGYRWSVAEYAELAAGLRPTWWAQMDFCCEPELSHDSAGVAQRIDRTVEHLHACQAEARARGIPEPMPVLQGWKPSEYTSGPAFEPGFVWPDLVGVGSVCRRNIHGPDGLLAVVGALDRAVPQNVRFHLFGVKSGAVAEVLNRWPKRLASVDSMAWNVQARWDAAHTRQPCTNEFRAGCLKRWLDKQTEETTTPAQMSLL